MRWLLLVLCGCSFELTPGSGQVGPDAADARVGPDVPPPSGAYSKGIRIHPTLAGVDLMNFPWLFVETADAALGMRALPDGSDIAFLDANGQRTPHELEAFNPDTGALTAWIRVPDLDSGANTRLTMIYGSTTSEPSTATAVWDADYEGVYHFNETAVGAVADSTSHNRDGAMVANPTVGVSGQIGTAFRFGGGNSFVTMAGQLPFLGVEPWTISVWAKATSSNTFGTYARIVVQRVYIPAVHGFGLERNGMTGAANIGRTVNGSSMYGGDPLSLPTATFRSLVSVYDGAAIKLYGGGVVVGMQSDMRSMPAIPLTAVFKVGADTNTSGGASDQFLGDVDEVRVSSTARSPQWIAVEQANQSNPTASYDIDPEVVQ